MIEELVKSVRLHLSERLTSPLLGAFVVSWCAWNFRAFFVLFSDEQVLEKFRIFEEILYPYHSFHTWGNAFVFPALTTAAYLYLYPRPAKYVYEMTRRNQRAILDIRRKIEDDTLLTVEESRRIKSGLALAQQEHYAQLSRLEGEIERLTLALKAAMEKGAEQQATPEPQAQGKEAPPPARKKRIRPEQNHIIRTLADKGGSSLPEKLRLMTGLEEVAFDFHLDDLRDRGLLAMRGDGLGNDVVFLTQAGREKFLYPDS